MDERNQPKQRYFTLNSILIRHFPEHIVKSFMLLFLATNHGAKMQRNRRGKGEDAWQP